jgi:prolyl-tRNA synthetase
MNATVLDQNGKEVPVVMGSYGIGVERIMAAAIELHHDADGIVWPRRIAPFDVVVTVTNVKQPELKDAGEQLYKNCAPPVSKSCSTTATSARASSSRTQTSSASPTASPSARNHRGHVELFDRAAKESTDVSLTRWSRASSNSRSRERKDPGT